MRWLSRRWFVIPLALAALWLLFRALPGPEPGAGTPAPAVRPRLDFRGGTWARADRDLGALLRELATRVPGQVRISGTVRDGSLEPVAGAEVVFASDAGEASTEADDDGRYTIEVPIGFYRAFARADGYVAVGAVQPERIPTALDPGGAGLPRAELAPLIGVFRDQAGVDMLLRRGGVIVGTVHDSAGRPVPSAVVTGRLIGAGDTRLVLGTDVSESDLDGSFRLEVPSGTIELGAAHERFAGLAADSSWVHVPPGDTVRVDITLAAGCIIAGQVLDSRGELVGDGSLERWTGGAPPHDFAPAASIHAGRFRLTTTESGRLRLRAWPWKSPHSVARDFDCEDGAHHRGVTFVIPEAEPDLEGSVWSRDGQPLAGAYIDAMPQELGGMAQQERADARGEWSFHALPPGRYQLMAYVPGHGAAVQEVTVPSRNVRLTLSGTGAISGHAQGMSDGTLSVRLERCTFPGEGGRVAMFDSFYMSRAARLVPVESGAFYIDDLPACLLRVLIEAPGRGERPVTVPIEAGGTATLSVDLREPRSKHVYGVVTGRDGAPLAGVTVTPDHSPGTPRFRLRVETDASGRYEVPAYTGDMLQFRSDAGAANVAVSWSDGDREERNVRLED